MILIAFMDYAGVALFAATGALAASRKQLDVVGFIFLSATTGIGGGTVRDLILGVPVFWTENPTYVLVCAATAVLVFFTAHLIESRYRLLLWLDGAALSAYGVFGAYKGLIATGSPTVAVVMGVMTGTLGGIIRDVIAGEPSVLMRQEVYVAAALGGGVGFVTVSWLGGATSVAGAAGFLVALALRGGAIYFHWSLPPYRARAGRNPDDIP